MSNKYNEIEVLKGLEGVRKNVAMYLGNTEDGSAYQHALLEIISNSIDEFMVGYATKVKIKMFKDTSVTVEDNGRGIPVSYNTKEKASNLELALTKLHAGGKFDKKNYNTSGGLHGVGLSVVNGCSARLRATVWRNNKEHTMAFAKGKKIEELSSKKTDRKQTGTAIRFALDPSLFKNTKSFDGVKVFKKLKELSYLCKGIIIEFEDERVNLKQTLNSLNGIVDYVKDIAPSELINDPIYLIGKNENVDVEIALQWVERGEDTIDKYYTNNIPNLDGGTHMVGFKSGLTRTINNYISNANLPKNLQVSLSGDDVREGLVAIVSIRHPNPSYSSQTKDKLVSANARTVVESVINDNLLTYLEQNPRIAKKIITKCVNAYKAREAAKKAREAVRKNVLSSAGAGILPGKLADCQSKNPEECELFIVEGNSAGGCFAGDTKVSLADGREVSFINLIKEQESGKQNYCYSINTKGNVCLAPILNVRKTKKNVEVIKVMLDNNKEIICTPDHYFMMSDNSYNKAIDLKNKSLKPFRRKISKIGGWITIKGYEMVWDARSNRWIFTHLLADRYNQKVFLLGRKKKTEVNHHINYNKRNNNPNNIKRMDKKKHLKLHTMNLHKTLHRPDVKEKCKKIKQTPEYRQKMSKIMSEPKMSKMLFNRAKKQWENEDYKNFMKKKWKEFCKNNPDYVKENENRLNDEQVKYWSKKENREKASKKTKKFFENNSERKSLLSKKAKLQWKNKELLEWRTNKTREQWTDDFRNRRKETLNITYYNKSMTFLKLILSRYNSIEYYDKERIKTKDKSILKLDTLLKRYFNNNINKLYEAIDLFNHKIIKITKIKEKIDVYDLEVPEHHNFALSAGVFVHNSSKMARDRKYQAILPLRGKVLNVEKAEYRKLMANEELTNLITAIGCGIGKSFDANKIRYHKVVIMSVDGDEPVCVKDKDGFSKIIKFKDVDEKGFVCSATSTMDENNNCKFKEIKEVVKHKPNVPMVKITTDYGRSVVVTGNHSVFVDNNGVPELTLASNIKNGKKIYLGQPKLSENLPSRINLFQYFWDRRFESGFENIIIKGPDIVNIYKNRIKSKGTPIGVERVVLNKEVRKELRKERIKKGLKLRDIRKILGYKQDCSISEFERGKTNPPYKVYKKWCEFLNLDKKAKIIDPIIDRLVKNNPSNRNIIKNWIPIKNLTQTEILELGDNNFITDKFGNGKGLYKWFSLSKEFFFSLGFWVAEGSSTKTSIQWAIGNNNTKFVDEIIKFSNDTKMTSNYYLDSSCGTLRISNKTFKLFFNSLIGGIKKSYEKEIPQIVFSTNDENKLAYLKGYFLGDGTISNTGNISFLTTSKFMARQLLWLLGNFNVLASFGERAEYTGNIRGKTYNIKKSYNIGVYGNDILKLEKVWADHKNAHYLENIKFQNKRKVSIFGERVVLLKVKNIEVLKDTPDVVYDFSVPETERFFCGDGILCHNTDSDIDGSHIRTLLLTFFFRQMPHLILNGNVYIARPPLYRVDYKRKKYYLLNDKALKLFIKENKIQKAESDSKLKQYKGVNIQRFKGLGEMNPDQLAETAMNPDTRIMSQVKIDDFIEADRIFAILMGNQVDSRRKFIEENSDIANLDI